MALVYRRSTKNAARRYEKSSGMEPNRSWMRANPGVNTLMVVNRGKRSSPKRGADGRFLSANPFQWIGGRKRHIHESPPYRTLAGAKGWRDRHPDAVKGRGRARLYATDEYGTVLTKAIPGRLLKNTRRGGMAYNIGALRSALRANYRGSSDMRSVMAAARRMDTGRGPRPHRRSTSASTPVETVDTGGMKIASSGSKKGRGRKKSKGSRKASSRKASSRKASSRKASSRKASSRKASSRKASKKAGRKKSRKGGSRKKKARATKRGGRRRSKGRRRTRRGSRRRATKGYFRGRRVRMTGREYIDKYLSRGVLPTVTRVGRLPLSRSGRQSILTYAIPPSVGRLSRKRRRTVRGSSRRGYAVGATYRGRRRRRMSALAANRRRRSRRNSRRRSSRRRMSRNVMYATANRRRRSRRNSRRRRSRRMSANVMYATANRRRSRRNSRRRRSRRNSRRRSSRRFHVMRRNSRRRRSRRNSRRRRSRRMSRNQKYVVMNRRRRSRRNSRRSSRRRMTRNMLAVSKLKYRGTGSHRMGSPKGRYYQLVEYGPKSGRKFRHAGYPVLVPPHVSQYAYVRKFRFGGAAKDAHSRAKTSGYKERRRYSRWRKPPASWARRSSKKMAANSRRRSSKRRSSKRRSSMRRNQKYVVMNRRRRMRRNMASALLGGADLMTDVVTPVIGGTVGFVAARVLSNGLANVAQVRGMLDSGAADAAGAANTKIAANLLGIAATLGLATKVDIIRKNRGPLVVGMGLALTDRLIQRFATGSPYGGYLGEYVESLGEYVDQPLSGLGALYAAAGTGEYVDQPLSGMMYAAAGLGYAEGIDPSNQAHVDRTMNAMEAAAGVTEAAAGLGADTMGSGEADAALAAMYAKRQPPFTSIQNPITPALAVTGEMPFEKEIPTSLVTPEGKGFAGGVFARHLFAGMF